MPNAVSPILGITLLNDNQNGAERLVNQAILVIEVQIAGGNWIEATAPPGSPTNGTYRVVIATATGVFTGQEGKLAIYWNGIWYFFACPFPRRWSSTEHLTGEYREGSPVYSKSFTLTGVANGFNAVAHSISGTIDFTKLITCEACVLLAGAGAAGGAASTLGFNLGWTLDATNLTIDLSGVGGSTNAKARITYCKV